MDTSEEHVETLRAMGFSNDVEIRQALQWANNDINEALSYLVTDNSQSNLAIMENPIENFPTSKISVEVGSSGMLNTCDDPNNGDNQGSGSAVSPNSGSSSADQPAIFPAPQLNELESRVFTESWNIPYKKDESLGRCLIASIRICKQKGWAGIEADQECSRFMRVCLKECFNKLLTSSAVNRWSDDILDGVSNMIELLIELLTILLAQEDQFPIDHLPLLSIAFDPECNFHVKTRNRCNPYQILGKRSAAPWSEYLDLPAASAPDSFYLCNFINCFAYHNGFQVMQQWVNTQKLSINEMAVILDPFCKSISYIEKVYLDDYIKPAAIQATNLFSNIGPEDFKIRTNRVFELLGSLRLAFQSGCLTMDGVEMSPSACYDVQTLDSLRLKTIYDMLGCAHFNARMIALKELTHELELSQDSNYIKKNLVLPFSALKEWLYNNSVLEKTITNLDNVHYSQKLKRLLLTLGDQVPVTEITRLWSLLSGQSSIAYDNVFALLATVAATKFNEEQLTHFFDLVRKTWHQDSSIRVRERLLKLIGSTGCEGKNQNQSKVSIRALELLWELCHLIDSNRKLIEVALSQHLAIVKENYYIKDHVKKEYITKCVEDVKKNIMTYFILNHLMSLLKILAKHQPGMKSEKSFLHEMNHTHDITRMIVTSLLQYENNAIQTHGDKLDANSAAIGGFTHRDYIQLHLDFLHYILQKAELFLIQNRAREIWKTLISNPKASDFDREVCMDWFAKSISDLEAETQNIIFTKDLFKLEASRIHNETGFRCFKAYFEKVNTNENRMKTNYSNVNKKWFVEKTELLGLDYLWDICLFTPNDSISQQAQEFLLEVTWTQVSGKPRKEPAGQHKKFFSTCKKRLEELWTSPGRVCASLRGAGQVLASVVLAHAVRVNTNTMPHKTSLAIERLLTIAEKYIEAVEEENSGSRIIPPHGSTYRGCELDLVIQRETTASGTTSTGTGTQSGPVFGPVTSSGVQPSIALNSQQSADLAIDSSNSQKMGTHFHSHSNERLGTLRERLWQHFLTTGLFAGHKMTQMTLLVNDQTLPSSLDNQLLGRLGIEDGQVLIVRLPSLTGSVSTSNMSTSASASSNQQSTSSGAAAISGSLTAIGVSNSHGASATEEDHSGAVNSSAGSVNHNMLPSLILSNDPGVYDLLLELGCSHHRGIKKKAQALLQLLPTQPGLRPMLTSLTKERNFTLVYHLQALSASLLPVEKPCWWDNSSTAAGNGSSVKRRTSISLRPATVATALLLSPHSSSSSCQLPTSSSASRSPVLRRSHSQRDNNRRTPSPSPPPPPPSIDDNVAEWLKILLKLLNEQGFDSDCVSSSHSKYNTLGGLFVDSSDTISTTESSSMVGEMDPSTGQPVRHLLLQLIAFVLNPNRPKDMTTPPVHKSAPRLNITSNKLTVPNLEPADPLSTVSPVLHQTLLDTLLETAWKAGMKQETLRISRQSESRVHFSLCSEDNMECSDGDTGTPTNRRFSSGGSAGSGDDSANMVVMRNKKRSSFYAGELEELTSMDVEVAVQSVRLLFNCLMNRPDLLLTSFLELDRLETVLKHLLVNTSSRKVRQEVAYQLERLALCLDPSVLSNHQPQPSHSLKDLNPKAAAFLKFLLNFVLTCRLPFWVNQNCVRSASLTLIPQCSEYFQLRGKLLSKLDRTLLSEFGVNLPHMIQDECDWLLNFTTLSSNSPHRYADDILLAGHLELIIDLCLQTAITTEGKSDSDEAIDKAQVGQTLIRPLLNDFLFSAARIMKEGGPLVTRQSLDYLPKCSQERSRQLAYELLYHLADDKVSTKNFTRICNQLIELHHCSSFGYSRNPESRQSSPSGGTTDTSNPSPPLPCTNNTTVSSNTPEWDYAPSILGRAECGLVGLRNGGATCYMNSVIQQLFLQPGLPDQLLAVDTDELQESNVVFQIQQLFGHLLESRLAAYNPEQFWQAFKFWGEDINPREQQDAFDFFQALIDQLDEELQKLGHDATFQKLYQGVFSDQKICKDCPHRYEREEAFFGLNVTVKTHDLVESLNQFVRGEILEGDNAYLCEKCGDKKRRAVKRLCIKTLPQVLCIQLKRFDFDWETQRAMKFDDYFSFPLQLDMTPYTVEGVESVPSGSNSNDEISSFGGGEAFPSRNNSSEESVPMDIDESGNPEKAEAGGGEDNKSSSGELGMEDSDEAEATIASDPPVRHLYNLVGVVVHSGQANAGHYYSFIKYRGYPSLQSIRGNSLEAGKRRLSSCANFSKLASRTSSSNRESMLSLGSCAGRATDDGMWIKFNDVTVEEVEMTETVWNQECFGGTFKATGENARFYPEERHRYWNAYMLFYERAQDTGDVSRDFGGPAGPKRYRKTPTSCSMSGRTVAPNSNIRVNTSSELGRSPGRAHQHHPNKRANSASFAELSELVDKGEKRGLFVEKMPGKISRQVREQNLAFRRNCDLYTPVYYQFVRRMCDLALATKNDPGHNTKLVSAFQLLSNFLFNSYLHLSKNVKQGTDDEWFDILIQLVTSCKESTRAFLKYLTFPQHKHLVSYLLQCPKQPLRELFVQLMQKTFEAYYKFAGNLYQDTLLKNVLTMLLDFLNKEAVENCSSSAQYFSLLKGFMEVDLTKSFVLLFSLNAFDKLIKFLIGPNHHEYSWEEQPRRWSSVQLRELSSLHQLMAILVLLCKLDSYFTENATEDDERPDYIYHIPDNLPRLPPHRDILPWLGLLDPNQTKAAVDPVTPAGDGPSVPQKAVPDHTCFYKYVRELLLAATELPTTLPYLKDLLNHLSYCNAHATKGFIYIALIQCTTGPTSELKRILELCQSVVLIKDPLKERRISWLFEGIEDDDGVELKQPGLLHVIQQGRTAVSEGRRAYQCMKFVVHLCQKCEQTNAYLLKKSESWEKAVQWLRDVMSSSDSQFGSSSTVGGMSNTSNELSNDTPTGRQFHRTISAQATLQEATRLLPSRPSPMDTSA